MKKKILGGFVIVITAMAMASNVNVDALSSSDYSSMLEQQNIEVLANDTAENVSSCVWSGEVYCPPAAAKVLYMIN